jgi:hypothetical protein
MQTDQLGPARKMTLTGFLVSTAQQSQEQLGSRRRRRIVIWTVAALVTGTVVTGGAALAISSKTLFYTPASAPRGEATLSKPPSWPVNDHGETYGVQGNSSVASDLVRVQTLEGKEGYAYSKDLAVAEGGDVASPKEAMEWSKAHAGTYIDVPVFEKDGRTKIGVFRVGDYGGQPFEP